MNRTETIQIMAILKIAYPSYYARTSQEDAKNAVALWAEMFADDPAPLVAAAVKALIASDQKGFPPHIGAVKLKLRQLQTPETMTELEAWRLVRKAIRGASVQLWSRRFLPGGKIDPRTSAQRNFEELPPVIQQLVGDPEQLAAWADVPEEKIETVVQSNFMRSYRARAEQLRNYEAIPADLKSLINEASSGLRLAKTTDELDYND